MQEKFSLTWLLTEVPFQHKPITREQDSTLTVTAYWSGTLGEQLSQGETEGESEMVKNLI